MSREVRYLADVIDADTLDSAWKAVIGLAGVIGVGAIVETRYSKIEEKTARLELVRFHLDPHPPAANDGMNRSRACRLCGDPLRGSGQRERPPRFRARRPAAPGHERRRRHRPLRRAPGTDLPQQSRPLPGSGALGPADAGGRRGRRRVPDLFRKPATRTGRHVAARFHRRGLRRQGHGAGKRTKAGKRGVELRPSEIECIRWAVAGKSLQDIARHHPASPTAASAIASTRPASATGMPPICRPMSGPPWTTAWIR